MCVFNIFHLKWKFKMHIFFKINCSSNYYILWMNAPEKSNSVGEWRVSPEHRVGGNRAGVWGLRYSEREDFKGVSGSCPSV